MSSPRNAAKRLAGVAAVIALAALPAFAQGAYSFSCLNVSPGATSAELDFAWIADVQGKAVVQLAKAADKVDALFPADKAQSFSGAQSAVTATLFNGDDKSSAAGGYSDKVVVKGLSPSSSYYYRVGDGKAWSPAYFVATQDPKAFGFFVVGDPQLGAKSTGPKTLDSDAAGWADTLSKASAKHPQAAFMVALGDEVNDYNDLKLQQAEYKAYFAPIQLKSLPVATVDGNHDFQMGEYYGFHYNQPNLSSFGTSYGNDGDYWFGYGDVLFLHAQQQHRKRSHARPVHPRRRREKPPGQVAHRRLPPFDLQRGRAPERSRRRRPQGQLRAHLRPLQDRPRAPGPRPLLHPDLPDRGRQAAERRGALDADGVDHRP